VVSAPKTFMNSAAKIAMLNNGNAHLLRCLRFAAGMISTQPGWSDKHPEEALKFIMDEKNFMPADVAS